MTTRRTLTITLQPDWRVALRRVGRDVKRVHEDVQVLAAWPSGS